MSRFRFIPSDWTLSDSLRAWTKAKGLTDATIEDELESFRDHEYKTPKSRPDACWRNWIKNGIKWGNIVPVAQRDYRRPEALSESQKSADILAFERDMKRLGARK